MANTLLETATATLLCSESTYDASRAALIDLHEFFAQVGGVRGDIHRFEHDQAVRLAGGLAVSPFMAATCLLHTRRTRCFLRGIRAAIQTALERFDNRPIHILYAGCGPYATLLLPLTTCFSPEQIQITCLDIHALNVASVDKLIDALQLHPYFTDVQQADAITYQHPQPLHIIVTETMFRALKQETQVAITQNLRPQLFPSGIFIPQMVAVDACLTDPELEDVIGLMDNSEAGLSNAQHKPYLAARAAIGRIFTLDHRTTKSFAKTTVRLPNHPAPTPLFLLLTAIIVYGEHNLNCYETSLTVPEKVYALSGLAAGTEIDFWYEIDQNPGIRFRCKGAI